ncbi:MAG: glycosyltransferase [Bacteroidales bacterium]|jgi:glycosyltransferase involved in cell wall biosynthesis|nr:glycosyltransferase [Bacteroidales bacterium]
MRILIVAALFYPQNSPRANRATELAKEFARQGHDVKVLTLFEYEDYSKVATEFGISIGSLGVRRWRSPDFGSSKAGFLLTRAIFRLLSLSVEFPDIEIASLVNSALKKENNYDLLISIAVPYPVHWGVAAQRNKRHQIAKVWVADCGDPYMGCKTDSFNKLFYFKFIEKWFMRKADFVSIPVDTARAGYYAEFQDKIRIIPQGFRIDPIPGAGKPVDNKIPTFAYAGGFIPNIRDPRPFLDYLTKIERDFKFIVFTQYDKLIAPYKSVLKDKLEIRSYIPRTELLEFMTKMDFLVNFDNNTGVQMPSKLIDYALVNRPILNVENEPDNQIIDDFLEGNYNRGMEIINIEQYDIKNVVRQFSDLV